jgi:hypothetical protein
MCRRRGVTLIELLLPIAMIALLATRALRPGTEAVAASAGSLILNGDFELASPESPPPGWTMWGAQRYKIPANYTRDTTHPHSGQACFRIAHPAGTAGYVVTDPAHASRPRRGQSYTVSFWARTDTPGFAVFGFEAYESIRPFVDAPAPGRYSFEVGTEWKRFTYQVDEGWDFFSDQSRYLLLTFVPARETERRTLWIDDVVVTEQPSARQGRLVDESRLKVAPVPHRLKSGRSLELRVDASKRVRRATRDAGGISFHRVAGWTRQPYDREGRYTLLPEMEAAIREMRLPMTRFYAVGDEPFGLEGAIDRVAEVCRRVGVPLDHVVLELEEQGATTSLAPEVWARGAGYARRKGYPFRYWEVANEPYVHRPGVASAFAEPNDYAAHVKAVAAAIHEVQPQAQIGLAINSGSLRWGSYLLRQAAGAYDFVVGHYYGFGDVNRLRPEATVLTQNYRMLDRIQRVNALIAAYNPGRDVYQYDTEWGFHSSGPNGERADNVDRNANIIGTLHRAVRLIYYVREGLLRGASSWEMFCRLDAQGFGVLSQQAPDQRSLIYWLYYYLNRHVGDWVLEMEGSAPYYTPAAGDDPNGRAGEFAGPITPAVATLSQDGRKLYLVAANGSFERAVPCRVSLHGFRAGRAIGTVLSHPDVNGKPLLKSKEEAVAKLPVAAAGETLTCTLPPHSVCFVTLERR